MSEREKGYLKEIEGYPGLYRYTGPYIPDPERTDKIIAKALGDVIIKRAREKRRLQKLAENQLKKEGVLKRFIRKVTK